MELMTVMLHGDCTTIRPEAPKPPKFLMEGLDGDEMFFVCSGCGQRMSLTINQQPREYPHAAGT